MADKIRSYESEDIEVTYSVARCIHAARCVHGLPAVFDPQRRPWIDPAQAPADAVAEAVERCPTGALQYRRKDGGAEEAIPEENTIRVKPDGPLYLRGQLEIELPDGTVLRETRAALCRCGASQHKPFCDNSHKDIDFEADGVFGEVMVKPSKNGTDGALRVQPARNGPLLVQGPLELVGAEESVSGSQAALCRCGQSGNKPFCDGSHNRVGFNSEG